ncbi:hypothetical protein F5883DRAFT_526080 [Diaporthe sp. PMI_573]|nr:hypothetical protein F5883DRAFT_526080 [Diaporthaceae sp. PMI_573]
MQALGVERNPLCSKPVSLQRNGEPVPERPYPSRLGFLHTTDSGATIRYVDLNKKLCRTCCDSLITDGKYLVWSVLAGTSAANVATTLGALLPGDGHFPPILQAGSELKDTSHNAVLPIPDIPGAKDAWQWLETQAKPFYIDQLHVVVGRVMSPLARKRAAKDSAVALQYGQVFNLDALRSPSITPSVQAAQAASETQVTGDAASLVKKTTSKKSSTKKSGEKNSDETSKKEKKEKKEGKEKKAARSTEVITSSEKGLTETRLLKSLAVLPEPTGADSSVTIEPSKTLSTNSLDVLGPTPGPLSTPNLATASIPMKSISSDAPIAATSVSDTKGANLDLSAKPVMTTTVKTLSRSWGWSEPFEFPTGPRKVPALSDYQRVAESRAPSQSTAKSLDNFLEEHLKLNTPRKFLGPGDFKSMSHTASSSPMKQSTVLQFSESKVSGLKSHDKSSSVKTSKDSDAKIKPKKPTGDHLHSVSSETAKPATSQETAQRQGTEKSAASKKTDHLGPGLGGKSSEGKTSDQSKQHVHKDASSTSSHRADKKVTKTQEVHEKSIKTKRTSDGPGSWTGLGKAGLNYFEHKLNEATEKTHKENKNHKKPSKPETKPDGKPQHESDDHSEDSNSKPSLHTGAHPPQPGHKPHGRPEHESDEHPEGESPGPSPDTGAITPQPGHPEIPGSSQPPDVPTVNDLPAQTGPPIQTGPSAQVEPPTGTSGPTQPGQNTEILGMAEAGPFAQSNPSLQATSAQGGAELDPSTQLPAQAGCDSTSYPPISASVNPPANFTTAVGESPFQTGTGPQDSALSNHGLMSSPTPPNGLGIISPGNQPIRLPASSGGNQPASNILVEHKPLPNQADTHASSEGPGGVDGIGGKTSAGPTQDPIQAPEPSVPPKPGQADAPANFSFNMPQSPGAQAPLGAETATSGTKPSDLPPANQSKGWEDSSGLNSAKSFETGADSGSAQTTGHDSSEQKYENQLPDRTEPSGQNPVKNFGTGPAAGVGRNDDTMANEPKRTRSKKLGSHTAHEKPDHRPQAHQSKLKLEHTPKRPHAVSGRKRRSGVGVAAGVLAGVAVGATLASVAGKAGSDEDSGSDSDHESTHAEGSGDDNGTGSDGSDDAEPASDDNDSSQDESTPEQAQSDDSDDSSDDGNPGNQEGSPSASESDDDDDQDVGASDPGSDDESGPEHDDDPASEDSNNEDEDEDASMGSNASEGENSDKESDGEEEDAENTQSESDASDNESQDSGNDATDQDSSEQEDNSAGDPAESSSEGGDNESGEEDDDDEAEQDPSSSDHNNDSSDHDDGDVSDGFQSSDEN